MNGLQRDSVVELYKALQGVDRDDDIDDELSQAQKELRLLKAAISERSKRNYMLEQDVRYLDSRIALLIQNKINADEAREVANRLSTPDVAALDAPVLAPDVAQLYGSLFFLLQSEPEHIAWLANQVTMPEIDELLQTVMFSIYGNQFDAREEHLLLVMFQQVLATQFETIAEFSSLLRANTPVSRMMMTYTRRGPGQAYLQDVMSMPIRDIIESNVDLDISPLRVFNELKAKTPTDPDFQEPFTVQTAAQHRRYADVQAVVEPRYANLQRYVVRLLDLIIRRVNSVPYGIRWMAKQVRLLAQRKFPDVPESQTASLIGGYFFLRFINPAIVTPHAYMLVEQPPDEMARRNLTMVAKFVQIIANQASGIKEILTVSITDFVAQLSERVRTFLNDLCDVPDFYDSLELDQYLALTAPQRKLKISHLELVNMHRLLVKYPSSNERVRLLLADLGEVPPMPSRAAKQQIELPLASRWEAIVGSASTNSDEMRASVRFLEMKTLLVNIRRTFPELPANVSLETVAQFAAQAPDPNVADRGMRAKLMLAGFSDDEAGQAELALLEKEVSAEAERFGSLITAVRTETKSLENVYHTVREHNEYLESQLDTFRSYLVNVRQQAGGGGRAKERQRPGQPAGPLVFTPAQMLDRGVLRRWPYGNWVSSQLSLRFAKPATGRFSMALFHRERAAVPLLVVYFTLDDLLELKDRKQEIDLRCMRLSPTALMELVGTMD